MKKTTIVLAVTNTIIDNLLKIFTGIKLRFIGNVFSAQ